MLDTARANALTTAITDSLADIGVVAAGGARVTTMPRSKGNLEPLAWEYFVASLLYRRSDARRKKAQAACVKAGVMFDPEKAPLAVGTEALVYAGDVVEISVSVTTAATRFDHDAFIDALEKAGVARKLLDKHAALHTHVNRAPHKFTPTLITAR